MSRDMKRLIRLARTLAKGETYRSHVGGIAYVNLRVLDALKETADRLAKDNQAA